MRQRFATTAHAEDAEPPSPWRNARGGDCELTAAQQARLDRAARDAAQLYPDKPELQRAAVEAAIEYLRGSPDLSAIGAQWRRIRGEEKRFQARVRQIALMAVADKLSSERSVACAIGVDRMRLRRWSGKPASPARAHGSQLGSGERR